MSAGTTLLEPTQQRRSCRGDPTWEMAKFFPSQGEWSASEYLALNTNHLIEFCDGCLEFLPMPTPFHQAIVLFLYDMLKGFLRGRFPGEVFVSPCPVWTIPTKYREPDVFYVRPERLRDRKKPPDGVDLAMEVVSGASNDRDRDLIEKRQEYAQAGIPEYWIVDPQEWTITVLVLDGASYREHGIFSTGTQATSVLLPGFSISVGDVFAAGEGNLPGA